MSETSKKIDDHVSKVSELKKNFMQIYKSNQGAASNLLKQMKVYHGYAIYDAAMDKAKVFKNDSANIPESDWIKLSNDACFLYVIHSHIRRCQMLLYKLNNENSDDFNEKISEMSSPELKTVTPINTDRNQKDIHITIRKNKTGTDEISIDNLKTDTESQNPSIHLSDIFTSEDKNNKKNMGFSSIGAFTDYINNLNTSEANRLEKLYDKDELDLKNTEKKNFEVDKPTIINFWADWCGWSKSFLPTWEKFREEAKKKFPNLQVGDLNTAHNKNFEAIAQNAGVTAYPTIVFFNKGSKYNTGASRLSVDDINKFIADHL